MTLDAQATFAKRAATPPLTPEATAWIELMTAGKPTMANAMKPYSVAAVRAVCDGILTGPLPMVPDVDVSSTADDVKAVTGVGGIWYNWPGYGEGSPVIISAHGGGQVCDTNSC